MEDLESDSAEDTLEEAVLNCDGEGSQRQEAGSGETQAGGQEKEAGEEKEEPEKKGFFKKKEKKDKKDVQIEELNDRLKRSMAEFENFRKRTEKEKAAMYEIGAKSVIEKILPVVDNFERGMATLSEKEAQTPFAEGMDKIYKQLLTTLESMDVKAIDAVGQEFNPDFHNAVMHVEDEESGENIIVEEFQKGYLYRDSVVRHSMVKVAN
ncbi:nucleotide exchange factor GrpE [Qiania dongpingensis]|uniref:Protein GrpE n=1 Tax=Qiania dongpingensis TaxID=2763669 RepID=A0A7G9G840_9FIRM|nr:nucleotide exchange factor GrpE [Qiania dongpingensis]QNM06972.1 nucleotide exchange factor GrpE [Qiania dongpingensis]